MNQKNILPCDGLAYVIDDTKGEFEWPEITACLAEATPRRIETARLFGRDIPIPRMTAWFGDADYTYSGICHRAAPFQQLFNGCANGPKQFLAHRTMRFYSISIEMAATASAPSMTPTRFKRSRGVGAYVGLTARRYASGDIDWKGRISKCGDAMLRSCLYEAANALLTRR
jgi:Transposase IS116/IS110/IS902 family